MRVVIDGVPYYSQFSDMVVDVVQPMTPVQLSAYERSTIREYWMPRACGAICTKSLAEFLGTKVPAIGNLCNLLKSQGAYDVNNGWIHDGLVAYLKSVGLESYRKEVRKSLNAEEKAVKKLEIFQEVIGYLQNDIPVMVSVSKTLLEQTKFHLILLVGFESDENGVVKIVYHDPELTNRKNGEYRECGIEQFMRDWRGKAIFAKLK